MFLKISFSLIAASFVSLIVSLAIIWFINPISTFGIILQDAITLATGVAVYILNWRRLKKRN